MSTTNGTITKLREITGKKKKMNEDENEKEFCDT